MNSPNISSNIARQILLEAKQNGVTVEEYLAEIAEENQQNGNLTLPKVRRTKTKVDLSKEREWLKENRHKYLGQWIVLDGSKLIGAGNDPIPFVKKARREGVQIPFIKYISEDDLEPFTGGWF